MNKKQNKQYIVLKGEGINEHVLHGDFEVKEHPRFSEFVVSKDGLLVHQDPKGNMAEHATMGLEKGNYIQGRQVEFSPFDQRVTDIYD